MAGPIEDAKNKRKAQLSRTELALRQIEGDLKKAPAKKDPPPPPPAEKVGVGRDLSAQNANALVQQARARIEAMIRNQADAESAGNLDAAQRIGAALAKEREKLERLSGNP